MRRRVLHELKRNASAVRLFQRVDELAVAVFVILVNNFDLAFELDLRGSRLPLRCRGGVDALAVGMVRKNKSAGEENGAGEDGTAEDRTAKDPRGTDPDRHGG